MRSLRVFCLGVFTAVSLGCATAPKSEEHHARPPHAATAGAPHGIQHRGPADHRFSDADVWASRFEDPSRDEWQQPDRVIEWLDVPPHGAVADIGAATGYFPVRIAKARPDVIVYGVDIEPDMVRYLGERAAKEGLKNLRAVLGEPGDPKIPEPVDRILIVNTYHHLSERVPYFQRLARALRPGARIVIVDFTLATPMGPGRDHKIDPAQVTAEMNAAGYALRERQALPNQYVLIFERGAPAN